MTATRLLSYSFASLLVLLFLQTAKVPVYVIMSPAIGQSVELYLISELTRANAIIDQLMETSPDVIRLKELSRKNITRYERSLCEEDLIEKFEAALYQEGIFRGIVCTFAEMLAYNAVRDIGFGSAGPASSILIYFLCKTVEALYELGQMIMSGFMDSVFAAAVESLVHRATAVDVYVRADDFNFTLLCLSSPQGTGKSGY